MKRNKRKNKKETRLQSGSSRQNTKDTGTQQMQDGVKGAYTCTSDAAMDMKESAPSDLQKDSGTVSISMSGSSKESTPAVQFNFPNVATAQVGEKNQILNVSSATIDEEKTSLTQAKPCGGARQKASYAQITRKSITERDDTVPVCSRNTDITIHVHQNIMQEKPEVIPSSRKSMFDRFKEKVKDFKEGHFILISCDSERKRLHEALALVPWTSIFNFDVSSRSSGLLSVIEDPIRKRRSLYINSWQDKCNITEESTHWVDLFGSDQRPESKTPTQYCKWRNVVQQSIETHVQSIARFADTSMHCSYTVVVIWPTQQDVGQHIYKLLTKLEEKTAIDVVILDQGAPRTKESESAFTVIKQEISEENLTVVELTIDDMCKIVNSLHSEPNPMTQKNFNLPTVDRDPDRVIHDFHAAWLKEDLQVLYSEKHHEESLASISVDKLKLECDNFYKGGTMPWYMWYEIGPGHVDVKRDIMDEMLGTIKKHIDTYKPGRIQLCHAPGSGGTTLAQRILWELHTYTPCAQIMLRTGSSIQDITRKIDFLYDKTGMPILLMMDGEDEQRVNLLMKELEKICAVILYIKRYPYPMKNPRNSGGKYWLRGNVSATEAKLFSLKFESQCDDREKRKAIQSLSEDIRNGQSHSVFEYGLSAYTYEYKGIEAYVRGFLQLEKNTDNELQPWQTALGILSLVYYYGQMSIPCQFFANILQRSKQTVMKITSFPDLMQELIVPEPNDAGKGCIRISHYYIAKEILEQILSWPLERRSLRSSCLCIEARKKLEPFAIAFIKLAGEETKRNSPSRTVLRIMTRTFISRDNKPAGEGETVKHKQKLAPILDDLESKPPYIERFNVLEQLTCSFPREAQYLAHLGRLYTICRPEEQMKAEDCFEKALEITEQETKGKEVEDYPYNLRLTLMYIYHMTGMMHCKSVAKFTGRSLGDAPIVNTVRNEAVERAKTLLPIVQTACRYFHMCREVTPPGHEESYGYVGEINVRLQLCDFLVRNCSRAAEDIFHFIQDPASDRKLAAFADECLTDIDYLLLDCYTVIEPDRMDESVQACATWYSALFKVNAPGRVVPARDNSVQSRRREIAARKLMNSNDQFCVLEHIEKRDDILFIVRNLEHIFSAIHEHGESYNKRALDLDYREWLFGIRHQKLNIFYSLEVVHKKVQNWHEEIHTPYSKFYLFIVKSLLGFGSTDEPGNTELLLQAKNLKEELLKQANFVTKPRYPREWLGTGKGIQRLAPGTRFFGQIEGREISKLYTIPLAIMKGTIRPPNDKPATGYIELDLGKNNYVSIHVFFVPARCHPEMKGVIYANVRVEFVIGFSLSHGYEAFNVRPLMKVKCAKCMLSVEYTSRDSLVMCHCGHKTKVSQVKQKNGNGN